MLVGGDYLPEDLPAPRECILLKRKELREEKHPFLWRANSVVLIPTSDQGLFYSCINQLNAVAGRQGRRCPTFYPVFHFSLVVRDLLSGDSEKLPPLSLVCALPKEQTSILFSLQTISSNLFK